MIKIASIRPLGKEILVELEEISSVLHLTGETHNKPVKFKVLELGPSVDVPGLSVGDYVLPVFVRPKLHQVLSNGQEVLVMHSEDIRCALVYEEESSLVGV